MSDATGTSDAPTADPGEVEQFWEMVRGRLRINPFPGYLGARPGELLTPVAWAFGATPQQADELLDLVLAGVKTATAGALWDYEAAGEALPVRGEVAILLDGRAHPRALIEVVDVQVVPFDEVGEEHARLEGEGDRSLAHWREVHQRFFTEVAEHDRGFEPTMPVVLERFRVRYPDVPQT